MRVSKAVQVENVSAKVEQAQKSLDTSFFIW